MEQADPTPMWTKIREGYLQSEESRPIPGPPAQGSSVRKLSPHNFRLRKPVGIELVEEAAGAPSSYSGEPTR